MDNSALLRLNEFQNDLSGVKQDVIGVKKRLKHVEEKDREIVRSVSDIRILINKNQIQTSDTLINIQKHQIKSSEKLGFLKGLTVIALALLGGGGATVANNGVLKTVLQAIIESL